MAVIQKFIDFINPSKFLTSSCMDGFPFPRTKITSWASYSFRKDAISKVHTLRDATSSRRAITSVRKASISKFISSARLFCVVITPTLWACPARYPITGGGDRGGLVISRDRAPEVQRNRHDYNGFPNSADFTNGGIFILSPYVLLVAIVLPVVTYVTVAGG